MAFRFRAPRTIPTATGGVAPFGLTRLSYYDTTYHAKPEDEDTTAAYQAPDFIRQEKMDSLKQSVADWRTQTGGLSTLIDTRPRQTPTVTAPTQVTPSSGLFQRVEPPVYASEQEREQRYAYEQYKTNTQRFSGPFSPVLSYESFLKSPYYTTYSSDRTSLSVSIGAGLVSGVLAVPNIVNEIPRLVSAGINWTARVLGSESDVVSTRTLAQQVGVVAKETFDASDKLASGITKGIEHTLGVSLMREVDKVQQENMEKAGKAMTVVNSLGNLVGEIASAYLVSKGIGLAVNAASSTSTLRKTLTVAHKTLSTVDLGSAVRSAAIINRSLKGLEADSTSKDVSFAWASGLTSASLNLAFGQFGEAAALYRAQYHVFPTVRTLMTTYLRNVAGESGEAAIRYIAQTGIQYLYYNEGRNFSDFFDAGALTQDMMAAAIGSLAFTTLGAMRAYSLPNRAHMETYERIAKMALNKNLDQITVEDFNYMARWSYETLQRFQEYKAAEARGFAPPPGEVPFDEITKMYDALNKGDYNAYTPSNDAQAYQFEQYWGQKNSVMNRTLFNEGDGSYVPVLGHDADGRPAWEYVKIADVQDATSPAKPTGRGATVEQALIPARTSADLPVSESAISAVASPAPASEPVVGQAGLPPSTAKPKARGRAKTTPAKKALASSIVPLPGTPEPTTQPQVSPSGELVPTTRVIENDTVGGKVGMRTYSNLAPNEPEEFEFRLVELDTLIVSHDADGIPNPAFDQSLQNRDRERIASRAQVVDMAGRLDPLELQDSHTVQDGAPVITGDGMVLVGNGRVAAIQMAYRDKLASADTYKAYVMRNAGRFDIDLDSDMSQPVLVRVRVSGDNPQRFVVRANTGRQAVLSASEQAQTQADAMSTETLSRLNVGYNGDINVQSNSPFISAYIQDTVQATDIPMYVTSDGSLTKRGVEVIGSALFARAYKDKGLLQIISESQDNDIKNITNTMRMLAPRFVMLQEGIKNGAYHSLDYAEDLVAAVWELVRIKESIAKGQLSKFDDYFEQVRLGQLLSPTASDLLVFLWEQRRKSKAIRDFLTNLIKFAEDAGSPNQVTMFGSLEPPDKLVGFAVAMDEFKKESAQYEQIELSLGRQGTVVEVEGDGDIEPSQEAATATKAEVISVPTEQSLFVIDGFGEDGDAPERTPELAQLGLTPTGANDTVTTETADLIASVHGAESFQEAVQNISGNKQGSIDIGSNTTSKSENIKSGKNKYGVRAEVAAAIRRARYPDKGKFVMRNFLRQKLEDFKNTFMRGSVPVHTTYADYRYVVRFMATSRANASGAATNLINAVYRPVSRNPEHRYLFEETVRFRDLCENIDNGLYPDGKLPFADLTIEEAYDIRDNMNKAVDLPENRLVKEAIATRKTILDTLAHRLVMMGREAGLDLSFLMSHQHYLYNAVLEHFQKDQTGRRRGVQAVRFKARKGTPKTLMTNNAVLDFLIIDKLMRDTYTVMLLKTVRDLDISHLIPVDPATGLRPIPIGYAEILTSDVLGNIDMADVVASNAVAIIRNMFQEYGIDEDSDLFKSMLGIAMRKQVNATMIIPEEVADHLSTLHIRKQRNIVERALKKANTFFKVTKLHALQFFAKYNMRNLVGDADPVVVMFPQALLKAFYSTRELVKYIYMNDRTNPLMLSYMEGTGGMAGMTAYEIDKLDKIRGLEFLKENPTNATHAVNMLKRLWQILSPAEFSNFREHILRFAVYSELKQNAHKHFREDGLPHQYMASRPNEIQSMSKQEWRIIKMTDDLLGAYNDASPFTAAVADVLVPFYRWVEINLVRWGKGIANTMYVNPQVLKPISARVAERVEEHVRIRHPNADLSNKWMPPLEKSQVELGAQTEPGKKSRKTKAEKEAEGGYRFTAIGAWRATRMMLLLGAFYGAINAMTQLFASEEDKWVPDNARNKPHLTFPSWAFGSTPHERIFYLSDIGSFADIFDRAGIDMDTARAIRDVLTGERELNDVLAEMAGNSVEWMQQQIFGVNPTILIAWELTSGLKGFYFNAGDPNTIRDKMQYVFQQAGFGNVYDYIAGLPQDNHTALSSLVSTTALVGDLAMWQVYDMIDEFKAQNDFASRYNPGSYSRNSKEWKRSNAAYYFKLAVKLDDAVAMEKYLAQYVSLGGTTKSLSTSLSNMNPTTQLSKAETRMFENWLDADQRKVYDRAVEFYHDIYDASIEHIRSSDVIVPRK